MNKFQFVSSVVLCGMAAAIVGCTDRASVPSSKAPVEVVELSIDSRKLSSAEPVQVRAALNDKKIVDLWFSVSDQLGSVAVSARLPIVNISDKEFDLSVSSGQMLEGIATFQSNGGGAIPELSGATVHIDVGTDAITGRVNAPSLKHRWAFAGKLGVTCWVPATSIPGANMPSEGISGPDVLVRDTSFSSDACAPFRTWIGQ
ncbi:MAG: hypothetical protein ABI560_06610 [Myxococcales bacterium]